MADRIKQVIALGLEKFDLAESLARFREQTPQLNAARELFERTEYTGLAKAVDLDRFTFYEALEQAGVTVYTDTSVNAYKDRMVAEHSTEAENSRLFRKMDFYRKFSKRIFWGGCAVTCVAALIAQSWWLLAGLIPVIGLAWYLDRKSDQANEERRRLKHPYWEYKKLSEYKFPIPKEIADRVLALSKVLPEVKFWVHRFTLGRDPILVAQYRYHTAFTGVWDEDSYEAEILG